MSDERALLDFEKASRFDRHGEPVTVSIAFSLPSPRSFVPYDGDKILSCQRRFVEVAPDV